MLTAIAARLDAIVNIRLIAPFHSAQNKPGEIAIHIFLQQGYLRCLSSFSATDHDGSGLAFASHRASRRFRIDALDSNGGTSRICKFDLERIYLVLSLGQRGGELIDLLLSSRERGVVGTKLFLEGTRLLGYGRLSG